MPILDVYGHICQYWADHFPKPNRVSVGWINAYTAVTLIPHDVVTPVQDRTLAVPPPEQYIGPKTVHYNHDLSAQYSHTWAVKRGVVAPQLPTPPVPMPTFNNPYVPVVTVDFSNLAPIQRDVKVPGRLESYILLSQVESIEITAHKREIPVVDHALAVDFDIEAHYDVEVVYNYKGRGTTYHSYGRGVGELFSWAPYEGVTVLENRKIRVRCICVYNGSLFLGFREVDKPLYVGKGEPTKREAKAPAKKERRS